MNAERLTAEEVAEIRLDLAEGDSLDGWTSETVGRLLATVFDLALEAERLRAALTRIAFEDELVYLGCSDIPHCTGSAGREHADDCVIGVARSALAGTEAKG